MKIFSCLTAKVLLHKGRTDWKKLKQKFANAKGEMTLDAGNERCRCIYWVECGKCGYTLKW